MARDSTRSLDGNAVMSFHASHANDRKHDANAPTRTPNMNDDDEIYQ